MEDKNLSSEQMSLQFQGAFWEAEQETLNYLSHLNLIVELK